MKKNVLLVAILLFTVLTIAENSAQANEFIRLKNASSAVVNNYNGWTVTQKTIEIEVLNMAYDKKVYVHHKKFDGIWSDIEASFVKTGNNNYEIWKVNFCTDSYGYYKNDYDQEFALRYEVNGNVYWNNNNGQNFSKAWYGPNGIFAGKGIVGLKSAKCELVATYNGYAAFNKTFIIKVKNIAYNKEVFIKHQKADHSWVDVLANYVGPANEEGYELWSVKLYDDSASGFDYGREFVVKYVVGGKTYYDNNGGADYSFPWSVDSEIEIK